MCVYYDFRDKSKMQFEMPVLLFGRKNGTKMSYETACKAIDRAFLYTKIHKDQTLWIDFIGGEPLLDFDMICKLVEYIYQKMQRSNINFCFH